MHQQAQSADDPERPLALRFRSGAVVGDPDAHLVGGRITALLDCRQRLVPVVFLDGSALADS